MNCTVLEGGGEDETDRKSDYVFIDDQKDQHNKARYQER